MVYSCSGLLVFWLMAVAAVGRSLGTLVVNVSFGSIIGSVEEVTLHDDYGNTTKAEFARYLGIPYAEAPIGDLRFRKPVPRHPWKSPHNGTVAGARCFHGGNGSPSAHVSLNPEPTSEDCLTLDIYAPSGSLNASDSYAVMVFMPSDSGSSHNYPGDVLSVFGDVIYVVVNFRTGLLGYFSLGDEVVPGNFGLWDQRLALQWINANIAAFNGDPERVTLISFGIGASRAVLQALYPGNHGLFHRVIAHSGSPFPVYKTSAFLQKPQGVPMAEALRCSRPTSEEIVKCMRSLSFDDLRLRLSAMKHSIPLTPVVDNDIIIDEPQTVLTSNDSKYADAKNMFSSVQLLSGITRMEGGTLVALMWTELLHQKLNNFQVNRTAFDTIVVPFAIELVFGKNISQSITKTAVFQYSDGNDPLNETKIRDRIVQLSTDLDTGVPVVKLVRFHSQYNKLGTFLYQFSAKLAITNPLTPSWLSGANYGDDIYYLLGFSNLKQWQHTLDYVPTLTEIKTSNMLMKMWSEFARNGNKNMSASSGSRESYVWMPYDQERSPYLDIGLGVVTSGVYFREPFMRFWTSIIPDLLEDVAKQTETEAEKDSGCEENTPNYHSRFDVNILTADNIIIALIIASFAFLLAFFMTCFVAMSKGTVFRYNVKTV